MICANCQREIAESSNFCYYCGSRQSVASAAGPAQARTLVRPVGNRVFAGVLAGFADYLHVDVTLLRVLFVIVTFFTGIIPGVVAYIVAWVVMPEASTSPAANRGAGTAPAKRLCRSRTDKKLGGVCAGLGEYLGTDVTLVRLLWAILTIIPGAILGGFFAYLLCWFVIPEAPATLPAGAPQHSAAPQHS